MLPVFIACTWYMARTASQDKVKHLHSKIVNTWIISSPQSVDDLNETSWMLKSTSWDLWCHYNLSVNTGERQPIVVVPDSWKGVLQLHIHIFCVEF